MATLEAIKGGGGSIRVGTVGTISTLISRELESSSSRSPASSSKSRSQTVFRSNADGSQKIRKSIAESSTRGLEGVRRSRGPNQHPISLVSSATPKRQKQKVPLEGMDNSDTIRNVINRKNSDQSGRTRSHQRSYRIPMLDAENIQLEKTPIRERSARRGYNIVDIVDINCGSPAGSISNRLKKLGFSKLSQSFM